MALSQTDTIGRQKLETWLAAPDRNQTRLAKMLGITQGAISNWLTGRHRPDASQRDLLETITGISRHDWFTDEERARFTEAAARAEAS